MADSDEPALGTSTAGDEPVPGAVEVSGHEKSLRGTMTAVLVMAAFFVVTWMGVWILHRQRG